VVVALRDLDGHTSDEVCDLLDISPGNQRVLLHRGRAVVRAHLERYLTPTATRSEVIS
jgi:RNA polymerase sigma-70 factor (ECF subfamily)